jgi:glycosyltransferase involved in cell wall biosynthesis
VKSNSPISLCVIAKNEERTLARALDSAQGWVAEIVVVDTGSTDATPEIARSYGAQVVPFDFTVVDFAAARNRAIACAKSPWILMLDADETLDAESAPRMEELIAGDPSAGYFLERRNHSNHSPESSTTDYVVRLFPNRPEYRYRGRVHETIDASILASGGKLHKTAIRLDHNFSSDREARRRKNRWYIEILKEEILANPADDTRLDFLAAEYHQLEMFAEAAAVAEQIVQMRPRDARAHLFVGVYHLVYQSDPVRARADFTEALRLRPNYPEAEAFLRRIDEKPL